MRKLLFIVIALVLFVACETKNEKKSQKQSEEELRTAIVGSWYLETSPESPLTESTNDSTSTLSTDDKGRMGMRREFFKDGRFMERENTEMIIDGDTLSFLLYSIRGKWEIHSDSLMLFANMKDVENPEHAGITVNSETIVSTKIIKRITADSLIIQDAAQEMNGNIIDLIMLREK